MNFPQTYLRPQRVKVESLKTLQHKQHKEFP
jgi:hypothetical protein